MEQSTDISAVCSDHIAPHTSLQISWTPPHHTTKSAQGAWSICWLSCCITYADGTICSQLHITQQLHTNSQNRTHLQLATHRLQWLASTITDLDHNSDQTFQAIAPAIQQLAFTSARVISSSHLPQLASAYSSLSQILPATRPRIHSWDSSSEILRHHLDSFSSGGQYSQQIQTINYTLLRYSWSSGNTISACVSIRQYTNCKHTRTRYIRSGGNTRIDFSTCIDKQIFQYLTSQGGSSSRLFELVTVPHTPIHHMHTLQYTTHLKYGQRYLVTKVTVWQTQISI